MNLTRFLGTALATLSLFTLAAYRNIAPQDPQPSKVHAHSTMQASATAKTIADCMLSCEGGAHHCAMLAMEGKKEHVQMHITLADCATICATTAGLVAHSSPLQGTQLTACATACDTCAAECAKSAEPMMKECAETCRKCASVCRDNSAPAKPSK